MSQPSLKTEILDFLSECGVNNRNFLRKCEKYMKSILEENTKYNLTAIKNADEFWVKHICDSIAISRENHKLLSPPSKVCDIGSGAGLPAVLIAIAYDSTVYAIESSQKKPIS